MTATHASILPQPRPMSGWGTLVTISLAALIALGLFVTVALPYLLLDPALLARYEPRRAWLLVHVAAGGVALLTGPVQLWLGVRRRAMHLHRRLGLIYVTAVAFGSVAAPEGRARVAHRGWDSESAVRATLREGFRDFQRQRKRICVRDV